MHWRRFVRWLVRVFNPLGWVGILLLIFGVPGHIDSADTWVRWLHAIFSLPFTVLLLVFIGFIITGPLLWTSGLWYPRVRSRFKRNDKEQDIVVSSNTAQEPAIRLDSSDQQFKPLFSVIKRQADSRHPPFGLVNRALRQSSDFDIDYVKMTTTLNQLGIPYPQPDTSEQDWYYFLVPLATLAQDGKVEEARTLWPTQKEKIDRRAQAKAAEKEEQSATDSIPKNT